MGELMLGCSGWNYPDSAEKGGWTGVFYPDKDTKRLRYYSQFFNTAEMDSTFYEKFYSHMTKGTFIGMTRATPEKFQFSIKVPETVTHVKRLDIKKGAMTSFEEFLDKISPLQTANKLGAILFQLPPSFTVTEFKTLNNFWIDCLLLMTMIVQWNSDIHLGRLKADGKCLSTTTSQQ
jgi:uncharacterized protein YecE (DUF72 family)